MTALKVSGLSGYLVRDSDGREVGRVVNVQTDEKGRTRDKVTAFSGHVKMREDYIESTVDLVKSNRTLVLLLTSYLPWGFLSLGVLLLALALYLEARGRRPGDPAPEQATEPQPVTA